MKKQTEEILKQQRAYFAEGHTRTVRSRIAALNRLEKGILQYEEDLCQALQKDLGKSSMESYMSEIGMTLSELRFVRRHVRSWSRERRVSTPLAQFPSKSVRMQEPYGVVLIMAPWNYPVLLTLEPLIGALAAGNCCVLKPSAYAPTVFAVLRNMIEELWDPSYVTVVEGGRAENESLLEQPFDHIFFTGGVQVGKLVMEKASRHLTPVTLELGGKSPCIIEKSANLRVAAQRIAFGKYLNCGQTCVAPDYILIEKAVKEEFLKELKRAIRSMYGEDPLHNPDYGKMINQKHFDRVLGLIEREKLILGGEADEQSLRIAPAVMDGVTEEDAVMQEEIFGPLLPILTVSSLEEAIHFVQARPKPLALYLFTERQEAERKVLDQLSFGGGCVNDTIIHLATSKMGFGGVGTSGMGSYHGKKSFETFSHEKSIVKKATWLDLPMRYQPYTSQKEKLVRKILDLF